MRAQAAKNFGHQGAAVPGTSAAPAHLVVVTARIVCVGSEATVAALATMLAPRTVERLDRAAALREIAEGRIGLLILDLAGPLARITNDFKDLRAAAVKRPLPVLALVPHTAIDTMVAAFEAGVADVASLPLISGEISARVRLMLRRAEATGYLRARARAARLQAMTDPVTRLYNRQYFDTEADNAVRAARAAGRPLTLLMVDIDLLKPVNDRFGHAAGDRVLAAVASQLSASLRNNDVIARFGGDEIVVAMPDTDVETAVRVAERLCASVSGTPIEGLQITVSIGVAGLTKADADAAALLMRADEALYASKRGGRNRVQVAP